MSLVVLSSLALKGVLDMLKKKEKKHIPVGVVHVQATFNNTIVTFTDPIGNVVSWSSSGSLGFRGSRKGTPFAAQQASLTAANKAKEAGMRAVEVKVAGPGSGRESAVRALHQEEMDGGHGVAIGAPIDRTNPRRRTMNLAIEATFGMRREAKRIDEF